MSRYETRPQWAASRERRWAGVVGGFVLLGMAVALAVAYFRSGAVNVGPDNGTLPLVLAFLLASLSLVPFAAGLLRRVHPSQIEVGAEALVLRFHGGRELELPWEKGPLDLANDTRDAPGPRGPTGLEVRVWVRLPLPFPGANPPRPQELLVSGAAYDEMRAAMVERGFRAVAQPWRKGRPGSLVQFVAPGEEAAEPPMEPPGRPGLFLPRGPPPPGAP